MDGEDTTRRRVLTVAGLTGAAVLSGCLRLTDPEGQSGGGDTATPTRTPVPTESEPTQSEPETETETATDGDTTYPPGVSEDGVSSTLVLSHRQAVADTSYTVETQYMFERRTTRIGDAGLLVSGEQTPDVFVADGEMYQRFQLSSGVVYGYRDDILREYRREALTGIEVLRALIEACNFRPVGSQTVDGETTTLIEADSITDQQLIRNSDNINRYFRRSEFPLTLEAGRGAVTQDGVIQELTAFLQGEGDGGEFLVRTGEIGSTNVSRPDWAATAQEQEAQFEARLVDDGSYIRVEQVAGQDIDAEMELDAYDGREYYDGNFSGTTSSGTVFFLYKTDEETEFGSQRLGISKDSRPSSSPAGTWSSETGWNLTVGPLRVVDTRRVTAP
jgi:hypothetical protein